MRAICVAGARPNFMKVKPVIDALEDQAVETVLVHTGQHYDPAMSDVFFADLGLRQPDFHLGAGSGTQAEQTARVMLCFEPLVADLAPDVVVVVGDVNSTVACALVTAKAGPYLAHVEAGLRSRDWSMPEEVNRVVTDRLSDFLLAPSPDAVENLRIEGYRPDQIALVGNVMVDTLLANLERALSGDTLARFGVTRGGFGLVTLHRPASVDHPETLAGLTRALSTLSAELPLVFPVHPRTAAALETIDTSRIRVIPPVSYLDFIALESSAAIVLTDSGGVQEETTVLGVPCLTLRENTERPITVTDGTNRVVGTNPARILDEARRILTSGVELRKPALWDGRASRRVADAIVAGVSRSTRRPTSK